MWFSGSGYLSRLKDEEPMQLLFFVVLEEFCCGCGGGCAEADIYRGKMRMFFVYMQPQVDRYSLNSSRVSVDNLVASL